MLIDRYLIDIDYKYENGWNLLENIKSHPYQNLSTDHFKSTDD